MDYFGLDDDERVIAETAAAFAEKRLAPYALEWDENHHFPTDVLREAAELDLDMLIVGEGPHWTAVDATDNGLVIVYAGHYATETLGVRSLAEWTGALFDIPWSFISAPTGL